MKSEVMYPSFSGIVTFMRAEIKDRNDVGEGEYAVIGVPYDTTLGSRPGARYGPRSIREKSVHFIYHLSAVDKEVIDVCSKVRYRYPPKDIVFDTGDVRVYPSSVEKTTDSIAAEIAAVVEKGAVPVVLGGDHYITYPCVKGFEEGLRRRKGGEVKIGYIHIDSHLDAYDENETWGKYYHGSPARRISELDSVDLKNMVWVGINGTTGVEPYHYIMKNHGTILTVDDVNRDGMAAAMREACKIAGDGCDVIYVTVDIDVVDQAYSAGTGSYIYGGITAKQLLEAVGVVSADPKVGAIDVVEVAPNLDPTGSTAALSAAALIGFLKPRIFELRTEEPNEFYEISDREE